MTEKILTSDEHPDDGVEPEVVEEDLSGGEPVEFSDADLDDVDFSDVDPENVPVLEDGADDG